MGYKHGGIFIDALWRPAPVFPGRVEAKGREISMWRVSLCDSCPGETGPITQMENPGCRALILGYSAMTWPKELPPKFPIDLNCESRGDPSRAWYSWQGNRVGYELHGSDPKGKWMCKVNAGRIFSAMHSSYFNTNLQNSDDRFLKIWPFCLSLVSQIPLLLMGLINLNDSLGFLAPIVFQAYCLVWVGSHLVPCSFSPLTLPGYHYTNKINNLLIIHSPVIDLEARGWHQWYLRFTS